MRIKKLELKNFRGFEELVMNFPEGESGLAVLVGVNGSGKTSVIEGLTTLLQVISNHVLGLKKEIKIDNYDILEGANNASGRLYLEDKTTANFKLHRSEAHFLPHLETKVSPDYTAIEAQIDESHNLPGGYHVPLISYYPSTRFVPDEPSLRAKDLSQQRPSDAYEDAFKRHIDYTTFFEWFRNLEDYENEQRLYNDISFRDKRLEAARRAISSFLSGFIRPRVRRQPKEELVIEKNGLPLSIANLSTGERAILALFGDIAHRLSIAFPKLEDPLQGYGIILIDEVERHLHPGWQRDIVKKLTNTFPNIQFILTTHSPQVLSNVPKENVFILENFKLIKDTPHTLGRDSNSILWDIFGVEKRPQEAKVEFAKLYRLMDDLEKVEETASLLNDVEAKYGYYDEEVVRARGHFQFLNED